MDAQPISNRPTLYSVSTPALPAQASLLSFADYAILGGRRLFRNAEVARAFLGKTSVKILGENRPNDVYVILASQDTTTIYALSYITRHCDTRGFFFTASQGITIEIIMPQGITIEIVMVQGI